MPEQGLYQSQTQTQTLVLAPHLRQGLEVLQATILELQALVEQEIQTNPVLEEEPREKERLEIEPGAMEPGEAAGGEEESGGEREPDEPAPLDFTKEDFAALARLGDGESEERPSSPRALDPEEAATRHQHLMDSLSQTPSLHDVLMEQLAYAGLTPAERQLAELLIGSVNAKGYLGSPLEEISANTGVDLPTLERVLAAVQRFDPPGVAARDLRECLLLQLRRAGRGESLAAEIVAGHLEALASRRQPQIARALRVDIEDVQEAAEEIAALEPMPGRAYETEAPGHVVPEVAIDRVDGRLVVAERGDFLPRLRISGRYRRMMEDERTSPEVRRYLLDKVKAAEAFMRNIGQRQGTLQRITAEILERQREFMEAGVSKLRPMTMAEVAERIGVHETTVSRAVSGKFVETPQGVYELKYFFTPGFKAADGQEVSNKTIMDVLRQRVQAEDPRKPLSDQALADDLAARGLKVARRTVAKYREELGILPTHMRRDRVN